MKRPKAWGEYPIRYVIHKRKHLLFIKENKKLQISKYKIKLSFLLFEKNVNAFKLFQNIFFEGHVDIY